MIEKTILNKLINDDDYFRHVFPYLRDEYFEKEYAVVFRLIGNFAKKYNKAPTQEVLKHDLGNYEISPKLMEPAASLINELAKEKKVDEKWLTDETEKWCKDRAIYLAIMESISIIDSDEKKTPKTAIPSILQDALAVSFDPRIGHDYIADHDERYDFYHIKEDKLVFDIELLNKITNGGVSKKTLNVLLGGTGSGKSLVLCHFAASYLAQNKNVLYITLEMAEEKIAERIDANLMNIDITDVKLMPKETFNNRLKSFREKFTGDLIIKEYPTSVAHTGHFRALINDLALKKSFKPDVIIIDYLNICASSRLKFAGDTYTLVKAIAEEVRGLAVEFEVPIWSATQTNRSGFGSSDVELTNTSESFGLPATADLFLALIVTEELDKLGQMMIKQLKNRYSDMSTYRRFCVGLNRSRMKIFDLEDNAQQVNSHEDQKSSLPSANLKDFSGFKV